MTSGLVSRNVTGRPAGTRISLGANANMSAKPVTVTLPSGLAVTPRSANRGSVQTSLGFTVSTWLGGRLPRATAA